MSNKNSSQVIMNDQQYYNGGYTKPGTLNKSTLAAMSRENLNHAQHRRMEPKHLQQPRPRSTTMQHQPDLIKDYGQTNGIPNGHPHSYQPDDSLRRSQGTNTKHQQQREFQIQNPQVNGRQNVNDAVFRSSVPERRDPNSVIQNRDLTMHKHKSVNGIGVQDSRDIEGEKRPRPRSRGVSANSSAIELINMNYNSIQQQLERNLRPPSRMKVEEGSPNEHNQSSITGRKTPHELSQTLPIEDNSRNLGRMTQAEIIRNRNMAASRPPTVEPPHLRKSRPEESSPGYQHFTQDKVSPIVPITKKKHEDLPRRSQSQDRNQETDPPVPRARIPPHERNSRMSKDTVDQHRKPRADGEVVLRRNPPPHLNTRQQPMGAESAPVQRPATSMGFVRTATSRTQNKENEQQLNVRQKLELLQRRKSGGPNLETNYKDFVADNVSPHARQDGVGQRPPSGASRRKSYTTSTPAKAEDRMHCKATEKLRQADGRTSRTSSDSSSSREPSRSSRTNVVAPQARGSASSSSFQDRSTNRWKEIERLSSDSPGQSDNRKSDIRGSRGDYPFFLDFSKSTPEITTSLDSLNKEVSDHFGASDRSKPNGDSNGLNHNDRKMTLDDLDVQGTPQLSSPVDFNPDGSSNEDLDLEVRTLLGQSENGGVDTLDTALYQKLISEAVHNKIASLRDRSIILDKKDGDLKSKRERLQRRMHQTLSKTTAMLNKSMELEKSRVHVELDVIDPSKAEELAVIHALSSTVRPKTPSGRSQPNGPPGRPQHVSDSFNNHSTIIHNDTFNSLKIGPCTHSTNFSQSSSPDSFDSESDRSLEVNEASLSFSFDSVVRSQIVQKDTHSEHPRTMSHVFVDDSTFYHSSSDFEGSCPEFHSFEASNNAVEVAEQSEINETSLSFSFHSFKDGDRTELNLSQCEASASISEYSQVQTPRSQEQSFNFRTMSDSDLNSTICTTPDLSIIEPCPSLTPKNFVYPMAKRLLFGKSRCSNDFSFSHYRPPNVTPGNTTSDQCNSTLESIHHLTARPTNPRVTTEKRKSMFSSTPVPKKQRRINSASVHNSNFKRFCRLRRVVNAKHVRRLSTSRDSAAVKRKVDFVNPSGKKSKSSLNNSSDDDPLKFRRYCAARRITVRKGAKTGAFKVRSIPAPRNEK